MYQYKHQKMDRVSFEYVFKTYMTENRYRMFDWEPAHEWRYYERNRSWMAAHIDHWIEQPPETWPSWFIKCFLHMTKSQELVELVS